LKAYGFSWSQPYLTVGLGDIVHWTWTKPTGVTGINFKVEQVEDPVSENPIGFTSGDSTSSGMFLDASF
jgi:hypothetical protein